MKRIAVLMTLVILVLIHIASASAQDDDGCRALMEQINELIGHANNALENGDVEAAQSLLGAAQTLAGMCLDGSDSGGDTDDSAWTDHSFADAYGGTVSLAYPTGWIVDEQPGGEEGVGRVMFFSSALALESSTDPEGELAPGEMVVQLTLAPYSAVGEYTGVVDAIGQVTADWEEIQIKEITETTINDMPAAYATGFDPEEGNSGLLVFIENKDILIMIISATRDGDTGLLKDITLTLAESIEYEAQ